MKFKYDRLWRQVYAKYFKRNFASLRLCVEKVSFVNSICLIFFGLFVIISFQCAHQVYPDGGPVDTEPPRILETDPVQNSLNVKTNIFHFAFSEYIDRRSFEQAIFISPAGPKPAEFNWSGEEVDVILPYELKPNKTYTITIGTDVSDVHNRNKMAESYTLAFATGNKIDSCFINGKIFDESPQGALVLSYKLDSINADTLNPAWTFPDYTTQSGASGEFSLKFLAPGKYRIFAIKDEYKNVIYDPGADKIGMWLNDIDLTENHKTVSGIQFKLSMFDTVSPKLYSAESPDEKHVVLKFSKNIFLPELKNNSFIIKDSITNHELKVSDFFLDPDKANTVTLLTEKQNKTRYIISVPNIKDSLEMKIDTSFSRVVFDGSDEKDTTSPSISYISIKDSSQNFRTDDDIIIKFKDLVKKDSINKSIYIVDTNDNLIKTDLEWSFNTNLRISPRGLNYNAWHGIFLDSIIKYNSLVSKKDLLNLKFKTFDKNVLSSIEGTLESKDNNINFVIEASHLESKAKFSRKVNSNQKFNFKNIPEGKYTFSTFCDSDSNNIYSYGKPFPYHPPEKFLYISDTIKVRARWPVEGVKIKFN
jgi:hypothetical protein